MSWGPSVRGKLFQALEAILEECGVREAGVPATITIIRDPRTGRTKFILEVEVEPKRE